MRHRSTLVENAQMTAPNPSPSKSYGSLLGPAPILKAKSAEANLSPREHGAYAILGIPIITALLAGDLTLVGICVATASVTGFLAHEPLLVALGHRGSRAKRSTPVATQRLLVLLVVTLLCGSIALVSGSVLVRWWLLICAVLAGIGFTFAIGGKHRTLMGQLWGVISLSAPSVPILLAGATDLPRSVEFWCTWMIGFVSTTIAVRGVIAAQKQNSRTIHWGIIGACTLLLAILTYRGLILPMSIVPMLAMSWYLLFVPPPAKRLKRVGWTLVVGTIASAIGMLVLLHGS